MPLPQRSHLFSLMLLTSGECVKKPVRKRMKRIEASYPSMECQFVVIYQNSDMIESFCCVISL